MFVLIVPAHAEPPAEHRHQHHNYRNRHVSAGNCLREKEIFPSEGTFCRCMRASALATGVSCNASVTDP